MVLIKEADEEEETKGSGIFETFEGNEGGSIIEEKQDVLKPEERGFWEIISRFIKYPLLAGLIFFVATLLASLHAGWELWRSILAAFGIGMVTLAVGLGIVAGFIITIPSDPPTVGLVTKFGRTTEAVEPPGLFLTLPFNIRNVILFKIEKVDQDFIIENVATKDSAFVLVSGHATWYPDPRRLHMFMKSGRVEGVRGILDNIFPQYQRNEIRKLILDDALGASETLTSKIVNHLTGEKDIDEVRKRYGNTVNGASDAKGLGILFSQINVSDVQPFGKTAKDAEKEIQEKLERRAEVYEIETRSRQALAKMFSKKGLSLWNMEEKIRKGEMPEEDLRKKIESIRSEDPIAFDSQFEEWFTANIEYEAARESPGSLIPGLRERLKKGETSSLGDLLLALLSGKIRETSEKKEEKPEEKPKETSEKKEKKSNKKSR